MTSWHARFETGHAQIDTDHREFVRQLDALKAAIEAGAGRERTVELIRILQQYALGHFAREESHMERVRCPARTHNCRAHEEFGRKLEGWLDLLTFSGTPVSLTVEVHRESMEWIEHHILHVDCGLRGCASK